MRVSIIAAIGQNRAIGLNGKFPWKQLPDDLAHFKKKTLEYPTVIMGRDTYLSIGHPLANRTNIVLSRNPGLKIFGCLIANSLKEALELANNADEVSVIGGESVFNETLPLAHRLYLTEIDTTPQADRFFPIFDRGEFEIKEKQHHPKDSKHEFDFTFVTYERKEK